MAKVMVVDDSKLIRKVLVEIFKEDTNLDVVADAENGLDAYEKYKKYKPDLVTMDMVMPVMNGIDALSKILNEFPDAAIVMVSAMNKKHMVINAIRKGAKSFILKPINKKKILGVVKELYGDIALRPGAFNEMAKAGKKAKAELSAAERTYANFAEWVEKISDVEYYELIFLWKKRVENKTIAEDEFNKKIQVLFEAMETS